MKIKTIVIGVVVALCAALVTRAQSNGEPAVKILQTPEEGVLKLVYAYETEQPVVVEFYNEIGTISSDKIKGKFKNGFSRKYDFSQIASSFWIEVASANLTVTYKIIQSKDRQTFVPVLETTTYNHVVAANN